MSSDLKIQEEKYELVALTGQHIQALYDWNIEEKHFEYYTCRPINSCYSFEEYTCKILNDIIGKTKRIYILVESGRYDIPIGKITLFDLNPRNHSAEFGYYLPDCNRAKGLGSILLTKFIDISFKDDELNLNKLYATTSSNNQPSVRLLEGHGFRLDGRLREHYWIGSDRYDQLVYSILRSEWMI